LKRFGEFQQSLTMLYDKLHANLNEKAYIEIREHIKTEIADARVAKKKFTKTRQMFDHSESKLAALEKSGKSKLDDAKAEHKHLEEDYKAVTGECLKIINTTLQKGEKHLVDLVMSYWNVYYEHFRQGLKILENAKSSLESLHLTSSSAISEKDKVSQLPRSTSNPVLPSEVANAANSGSPVNSNRSKNSSGTVTVPAGKPAAVTKATPTGQQSPHNSPQLTSASPIVGPVTESKTKIFGVNLKDIWEREGQSFPKNIAEVFKHLEEFGPTEDQLFKDPGKADNVNILREGLDKGLPLNSCGVIGDTLSVATWLKNWLESLPDPLMTHNLFNNFIDASGMGNFAAKVERVQGILNKLPLPNRVILYLLLQACFIICRNASNLKLINDLAIDLSIALGPAALRPPKLENPEEADKYTSPTINMFKFLILNVESFFPPGCEESKIVASVMQKPSSTNASSPAIKAPSQPIVTQNTTMRTPSSHISLLATDVIGSLDLMKLRAAGIEVFDDGGPILMSIKSVMPLMEKLKPMLPNVPQVDKSQLAANTDDKIQKLKNVINVFASEIQLIVQTLKENVDKIPEKDVALVADQLQVIKSMLET
jgi:hypothetical protein